MTRVPFLAALPLLLSSCGVFGGLDEADRLRLQTYIENSGQYFNAQRYEQAIDQTRRGLELDEDNYQLLTRRAWSYLLWSQPSRGTGLASPQNRPLPTALVLARLEEALKLFQQLIARRSLEEHDPRVRLGHATALFNRALLERGFASSSRQEAEIARGADKAALESAAAQHQGRFKAQYLSPAIDYFNRLAESQRTPMNIRREAYSYLRRAHNLLGDKPTAIQFGLRGLEMIAAERRYWAPNLESTQDIEKENALRETLKGLDGLEILERQRLATYFRELGQYGNAIEQYNRVLTARPKEHQDYYYRGVCFRALGMAEPARKDFKTFLVNGEESEHHPAVRDATAFVYGKKNK